MLFGHELASYKSGRRVARCSALLVFTPRASPSQLSPLHSVILLRHVRWTRNMCVLSSLMILELDATLTPDHILNAITVGVRIALANNGKPVTGPARFESSLQLLIASIL